MENPCSVGSVSRRDQQPWDRGEEVDPNGWSSDGKHQPGICEVFFFNTSEKAAPEDIEGLHDALRVFGRWSDPDVEVFGVTGLGVSDDRVGTDDQIPDLKFAERL